MSSGRHRWAAAARRAAVAAVVVPLVAAGAVASARLHLESSAFRRGVAFEGSRLATGAIPGEMRLRGLHAPENGELRVDRFEVDAPGGSTTLRLEDVVLRPAWLEMVRAPGFLVHEARVGRGRIRVGVPADAKTSLERAFGGGGSGGKGDGSPGSSDQERSTGRDTTDGSAQDGSGPALVSIPKMRFRDLVVHIQTSTGPDLKFSGLRGGGELRLDRGDDVVFRAWSVSGEASTDAGPGLSLGLEDTSVWLDGGEDVVVEVAARARFAGGAFPLAYAHDTTRARGALCAWVSRPSGPSLALQGIRAALGVFGQEGLRIDLRDGEPPDPPRCEVAA